MAKLKFMGISHEQRLLKGDDFGGRLGDGIPQDVTFNRANNWIVDTDQVGLSSEAVEVLVSTGDWKDVTGLDRIPLNRNQTTFLGMKDGDTVSPLGNPAVADEDLQYAAPESQQQSEEVDPEEQARRDAVEVERQKLEAEVAASDKKTIKQKG